MLHPTLPGGATMSRPSGPQKTYMYLERLRGFLSLSPGLKIIFMPTPGVTRGYTSEQPFGPLGGFLSEKNGRKDMEKIWEDFKPDSVAVAKAAAGSHSSRDSVTEVLERLVGALRRTVRHPSWPCLG